MYQGLTPTKFGRYAVPEPPRFDRLHLHKGEPLKEVSWDIPIPVLDQEDLYKQGLYVSQFIPGAKDVDALGSCTANATMASVSERYHAAGEKLPLGLSATDAIAGEKAAISFYHACTDQTGDPSQEWPPTDCGSTGLYCCTELEKQKLISSYQTASGAQNIASLLQTGSIVQGTPFFNAWETTDASGFVDGDGSRASVEAAIDSGLAGGHETCIFALERLMLTETGLVVPEKCVLLVRNSWSKSWGIEGCFRLHLSTLAYLSSYCDFKQFVLAA